MWKTGGAIHFCICLIFILGASSVYWPGNELQDALTKVAPSTPLLSAIIRISKHANSNPVDYFDYNSVLNKDLDQNIFPFLGAYGVRRTIAADSPFPPPNCRVKVVNSLERHGARLMTTGALKSANNTVVKIQAALKKISVTSLPFELRFLRDVRLLSETSSLLPYGALQSYYSGRSSAAVYSSLHHIAPFVRASGDEATHNDRVILTAKYWRLGFTGGIFPTELLKTAEDVRRAAFKLPQPDVIFSEMQGSNNTLDVSTCPNYNDIPSAEGENGAQTAFATSTIIPTVGARLASRFASAGIDNLKLSGQDLLNLAMLCSFDTLGRASIKKGQISLKQSGFCGVFKRDEWPILGYAFDVGKWKGRGYGNLYYKALGTGYLRELIARFNDTTPNLSEPTSLNTTVDGNPALFPLPNTDSGPVIFFDGSHDNNIAPIVASLGLFNGPNKTTSLNAQNLPHNWIFSQIAPFQGKIVFEKLSCDTSSPTKRRQFVQIRVNGAILSGWCGDKETSLCPFETFLDKVAFVQRANQWNTCST